MQRKPMPTSEERPRVVVVVDRPTFDNLEFEPEGAELLERPDVEILSYPPQDHTDLVEELTAQGLMEPGQRLVQSPFQPRNYSRLGDARNNFAVEKHLAFASLCGILGAKEISVEQVEIRSEKGTDKIVLRGQHLSGIAADAKYHKEVAEHLEGRLKLTDTREGSEPDVERAWGFLRSKRLMGDAVLVALIEDCEGGNPLKERVLSVSLTDESTSRIEAAANLFVPTHGSIGIEAVRTTSKKIEYRLTYRVRF